ncbi:MAG: hypothetical protein K2Z81_07880 [Cyanobacteria bacterium]|nr:hypothetical protein [Cyanobacteriota bacterium]
MISKRLGLTLLCVGFWSAFHMPAYAGDPAVGTSVQRISCDRNSAFNEASATYKSIKGADGFGPTNQFVLASTTTNPANLEQAGYAVIGLNPLPPATQATGFRNIRIIFGQKDLYGDAVLNGKCQFTFLRPNNQGTITFLKKWSEMRPSAPADWRSLFVSSLDFGGFNVAECTLTKVVCYIDNANLGSAVYLGDFYVQYGNGGTYNASFVKFNDGGCSQFPPVEN